MARATSADAPIVDMETTKISPIEETQSSQPTLLSVVDEYHGQGGTYLLDPETGIRTLVERTLPASL
jgi:hypothetical protein